MLRAGLEELCAAIAFMLLQLRCGGTKESLCTERKALSTWPAATEAEALPLSQISYSCSVQHWNQLLDLWPWS